MEQDQAVQAPVVDEPVAERTNDGRVFDNGDVQEIAGVQYEVTAVSFQSKPDVAEHFNFQYTFKDKAELDAEREEEARLEQERKQNEANALAAAQDQLLAEGVQTPPVA